MFNSAHEHQNNWPMKTQPPFTNSPNSKTPPQSTIDKPPQTHIRTLQKNSPLLPTHPRHITKTQPPLTKSNINKKTTTQLTHPKPTSPPQVTSGTKHNKIRTHITPTNRKIKSTKSELKNNKSRPIVSKQKI
ncbi:hypothetical protein HYC85_019240 [Camellia sinensis]|uniref:Uncharacterized protein n=1 Tax=Camellia sinensis TaxID=4442 RepID=A0A7J7GQC0_CAMSI|nr:hypothetical protein HYC85_019240 [Camellia sinensis]